MEHDGLYTIYALADPRSRRIRYVGKTKNLKGRRRGHGSAKGEWRLKKWIADLQKVRKRPILLVLQRARREDAFFAEASWIQALARSYPRSGVLLNFNETDPDHMVAKHEVCLNTSMEGLLSDEASRLGLTSQALAQRLLERCVSEIRSAP
jgi:hypothetical protein